MTANEVIMKMVKLALRRHQEGIPQFIICFDDKGREVSWSDVCAASPKTKQGKLEAVEPEPGTGYYCHIRLSQMSVTGRQTTCQFEIASPGWKAVASFVEPGASTPAFITNLEIPNDPELLLVLDKIGQNLL